MTATDTTPLDVFREFCMTTGEMLCFHGQTLEKHRKSLQRLTNEGLLTKERFSGAYSLTAAGFTAMRLGNAES